MANQCCTGIMKDSNEKSNDWSLNRSVVRKSWNSNALKCSGKDGIKKCHSQTPMRLAWNSGDPLLRQAYVCGGGTQTNASRPGTSLVIGGITNTSDCDPDAPAPSYANNKWVYDGADRVRFLREQADNRFYRKQRDNKHASKAQNDPSSRSATMAVANALWRIRK